MARAPVSKTGGWGFESLHSCHCAIDNAALMMNLILAENGPPICSADVLLPIISTVRSRRLPISGTELWPTLQRHGMSEKLKDEFCHCFDFGNELLVSLTWSAGH